VILVKNEGGCAYEDYITKMQAVQIIMV